MKPLRFRQIHLDYHTSEQIRNVGADFDADLFAETLKNAHVNSVTCFAMCHHGRLYYDSKLHPELVHPHLCNRDMLPQMIAACHARGIRVPVYITVQWHDVMRKMHPEWRVMDENGSIGGSPYRDGFYQFMCVNSPYRDFLKEITAEVLETMPDLDGLFFDIVQIPDCSCQSCMKGMKEEGLEPHIKECRMRYARQMIDAFKTDMTAFVRQFNQTCSIFYNGSHVGPSIRQTLDAYTHLELESLPGGAWGYMHFPLTMRYARTLGKDCLAHTGKFHTEWGDFHSFKNPPALEYECFRMLALNAKCLIGDQLEPSGALSKPVYDLIGPVYRSVAEKEPWCQSAHAVTEIGVLTAEEFDEGHAGDLPGCMQGAVRMLEDASYQFDVLDSRSDFSAYRMLILPDKIPVDSVLAEKLEMYTAAGGKVLMTFESGLNEPQTAFAFGPAVLRPKQPMDLEGQPVRGRFYVSNNYADYVLSEGALGQGLYDTEYVMYGRGCAVEAKADARVLLWSVRSCFDRDYRHYCSHRQAPSSGIRGDAAAVLGGGALYFAHPLFTIYQVRGAHWCKTLLYNAIDLLLGTRLVQHDGPSSLHLYLNEQTEEKRYVLHALHYIPVRKSAELDVIEDVIDLYNVNVTLHLPHTIQTARQVPEGVPLDFRQKGEAVQLTIPRIHGHSMAALDWQNRD